jgi:ribonuclease HI
MGIEETSQASPTQRGERPGNRTFVPETPHLDKGKAAAVQPSAAGAVSQTPEARMQQMAEEIEDLKRMNASLVRQLCPSPHGRVNVEGQPFSETDSDEFSADEEEYVRVEDTRGEGRHDGSRQTGEGGQRVQANDQRPPQGSNEGQTSGAQHRRRQQNERRTGDGAHRRRLNFEGENRRDPELGHFQVNPPPPHEDMHALIRGLEAKYDAALLDMGRKQSAVDSILQRARSVFTPRVMSYPVPARFKVPPVKNYDGTGDPVGHLKSYKAHIDLHATTDEIACRAFPLTLEGSAQEWFGGLPSSSIDSFEDLAKTFLTQFLASKRRKNTLQFMLALKQGENEPLKDYLQRFNKERVEAEDMSESVVLTAAINGLHHKGPFVLELAKKTPTTLREFMEKAEEFINQEEMMRMYAERDSKPKEQVKKKEFSRGEGAPNRGKGPKKGEKLPEKKKPAAERDYNFTPLNTTVAEIYTIVKSSLRPPKKMHAPPEKRDMQRYCDYHQDHGHETEDCVSLRWEIERMIKGGKLARFVAANKTAKYEKPYAERPPHDEDRSHRDHRRHSSPVKHRRHADDRRAGSEARHHRADSEAGRHDDRNVRRRIGSEVNRDPIGEIHTIAGGFAAGGSSSSSRRAYARRLSSGEILSLERPSKARRLEHEAVSFSPEDEEGVFYPHDDALVITLLIGNFNIHRVLVDNGSSADILFLPAFKKMGIEHKRLIPAPTPLVGFTGEKVLPVGTISLPLTAGTAPKEKTVMTDFLVVDRPSAYNAIIGRPTLNKLMAVTSTYHLKMKFPTSHGVGVVRGDQKEARQCYNLTLKEPQARETLPVYYGIREEGTIQRAEPNEDLVEVAIGGPDRTVKIGSQLPEGLKTDLSEFLKKNADVFAWSHEDMPGIDPAIISHRLNIDPAAKPVKQKKRNFAPERNKAIAEEIDKLMDADFIREVHYPEWLANVVMVKKPTGKWRMCVDFTDLNKACPKDSFPLPRIDLLVDSTSGHNLLSFMDAFSGYNQIRMHEFDQEATSFITDRGLYCYKVMPFGLKNAGATYQRLVNAMFKDQIGRNVEVYVDDMLVKSLKSKDHLTDLEETFGILRHYKMKLNPAKCAFGVSSGKFLGFMVSHRGIEANPEKIKAVLEMESPQNTKQLQRLTGRVAALNRFISRSTDKCLPFFKILKKAFVWGEECEEAFRQLKSYLVNPPLLSRTAEGEPLYVYLAVSDSAVSSVLIREDQGVQKPVYYTSRALRGAESRYPQIEKLAFALVTSARRLRPYFQAHTVRVLTDHPLKRVLFKPDTSGRLVNWAVELGEFDIEYLPRPAIKGQALADFIAEFTSPVAQEDQPVDDLWKIGVDGSATKKRSGAGIVLITPEGQEMKHAVRMDFKTTNNEAEYEAVVAGLTIAHELGARNVEIHTDSRVVAGHILGEYEAKGEKMKKYLMKVKELSSRFSHFSVKKVPREENMEADRLARIGSAQEEELGSSEEQVRSLPSPSILDGPQICVVQNPPEWATEIFRYITEGQLPEDRKAATKIRQKASKYTVIDGFLYRRGLTLPLLKCLSKDEADQALKEIHGGVCGSHSGGRILAHKAIRAGYYWPKMYQQSMEMVKACDKCQKFANDQKSPPEELTSITSPWPFSMWGVDIVGPLPPGKGGVKFVVVAVDYFTKWVEAEALVHITSQNITKFLWRSVICRYGLPHAFVTDNGKQFDCQAFRDWCKDWKVRNYFSSPGHPQANGQVEATNKTIFKILKKKLEDRKGAWAEQLHEVLWAYRTTERTPTGDTPFGLAFGSEAVVPVETELSSLRVQKYNHELNEEGLKLSLDLLEERRDQAEMVMASYRQKTAQYFNRRVKPRSFKIGDWVLRKVTLATKERADGKLAPNWEGPYRVVGCNRPGTYHLETSEGRRLSHPWNAEHLKRYYQ